MPVVHTVADFIDDAGSIHAWHVGARVGLLCFGPITVSHIGIGRVDCGGVDAQSDLAWSGMNLGQIDEFEGFGPTVCSDCNSFHAQG